MCQEQLFNVTQVAMRQVAIGFVIHAAVQALETLIVVMEDRNFGKLSGLGGIVDELLYAYFTFHAATHFGLITTTKGEDISRLTMALYQMTLFWKRMRVSNARGP